MNFESINKPNQDVDSYYNDLVNNIVNISLYELWRIYCVVYHALEDPHKRLQTKKMLKPGMDISYFTQKENRLIYAIIIAIDKNQVLVCNKHDAKRCWINLYMINIDNIAVNKLTTPILGKVTKLDLKVGDKVGWTCSRTNTELYGLITKLNTKTAKIELANRDIWTVYYESLFTVFDCQHTNTYETTYTLIEN